jgi:hypothetical protein
MMKRDAGVKDSGKADPLGHMVVALLIPMDSYVFLPRRWFTIL